MNEFNTYPVFVADQVLTANHLNQVVNYLDEQDRLTRNKLIGIGIVCGLELKTTATQIAISKGCGVTSEGYLMLHDDEIYTHFRPYALPEFFSPEYKTIYQNWHMWELLTIEKSLEFEDENSIKSDPGFMKDKIVVLLLEMKEKPLKNCIEIDCEDKGDKIEFNIKPLLVLKADLDEFIQSHEENTDGETEGGIQPKKHNVQLKRFNAPFKQLKNSNDVFNSFLQITNESTLKQLAETLNHCYFQYQPVLEMENNPFENVFNKFKDTLSHIKVANPFFIQYFYDWIDDIVKAYNEFEEYIFDVQVTCCPDEGLFPLHLMLGEANKSTSDVLKSNYRNYFIYSPLFNNQKNRLAEMKLLFDRLQKMVEHFAVANSDELFRAEVKITPSKYLDKPLSDRCIPYYYQALEMYPVWSWQKTRRGKGKSNLSYRAAEYSSADQVIHPLLYDIEAYNFFRIEGHIGKPFIKALSTVVNQRDHFNLPFDVLALSTATVSEFFNAKDHECHFKDLQAIYEILLAEMKCKLGDFECMAAKIPYQTRVVENTNPNDIIVNSLADNTVRETIQPEDDDLRLLRGTENSSANIMRAANEHTTFRLATDLPNLEASFVGNRISRAALATAAYQLGDFLRSHCTVLKGSVGELYLKTVSRKMSFNRVAVFEASANRAMRIRSVSNFNTNTFYAYLFHFIDSLEKTFQVVLDEDLESFDPELFNARYKTLMDAVDDLANIGEILDDIDPDNEQSKALLDKLKSIGFYDIAIQIHALKHVCLDDKLQALKEEYEKRVRELRLLTNLMHYAQKHPGMEHKAGVPKGGTFILVYHETPPRRLFAESSTINKFTTAKAFGRAGLSAIRRADVPLAIKDLDIGDTVRESYIRDPKLLGNFEKSLNRFMDACNDMDEVEKGRIRDILVNIPREPEPPKFRVPEQAVIADFYLPYICCSDCAPISYVVPKVPEATLNIGIQPTEFCNDDENVYPVSVSPPGGELKASLGGISEENGFVFAPKGLNAGINKLTYALPDGRSTTIDLLITQAFEVSFRFKDMGELTLKFLPAFEQTNRKVLWDFGDGKTSEEFSPSHTYSFDGVEASFVVNLSVTDSPCIAETKQTVALKKAIDPEFDLLPRVFCVNDQGEYGFAIQPFPKKETEITNSDKLLINFDAAGQKIIFVPAKHKIKSSKDFHLEYKEMDLDVRVLVPDASFLMNIESIRDVGGLRPVLTHVRTNIESIGNVDFKISLAAKQTDATNYKWNVAQGDIRKSFEGLKVDFSMAELGMKVGTDIGITLAVNHQLPTGDCRDEKKFAITSTIFRLHTDKGAFDNNTTS